MSEFNDAGSTAPPLHHIHNDSSPLPGARGADPTYDYSASKMDRAPNSAIEHDQWKAFESDGRTADQTAVDTEKPMDVKPTAGGGVAIGGNDDLPTAKASFGDKVIGKTQKVVGKLTSNPEKHEAGELRESGGKSAVLGHSKAPRD